MPESAVSGAMKDNPGFSRRLADYKRIFYLNWAIFEIAADTRKISLRYSPLCGAESDVVDAVIS